MVKDLGPYSSEEFLENLSHKFSIEQVNEPFRPQKKFEYGLYLDQKWYKLDYLNVAHLINDPVKMLDVSVLRSEVMTGILGITNFRSASEIAFVEGVRGIDKLVHLVDKGEYKLAFTLCPANIEEMFAIANHHEAMPPKATCIEPKLKSGMISRLLS